MANRRRKRSKKWLSWIVILILLIVAGVVCYFVWDSYFRDKSPSDDIDNTTQVTDDESDDRANGSNKSEDQAELKSGPVEKKKVEQYEGSDPNEANDLSGAVTYAGVSNGKLMIRVNIDQYLTSGKCELTLVRSGATIYNSIASIIGNVTSATCEGFDVPVSELGGGNIIININLSADNRKGIIRGEANI